MTLYLVAERILRIYSGGNPSDDSGMKIEDIKHLVIDQINRKLKVETLSVNKQLGDNFPPNLTIATYDHLETETYKGTQSRITLPAIPVSLPNNMGVWAVYPNSEDDDEHNQFVPIQSGQWGLIKDQEGLVTRSMILGNHVYEVSGKYIVFPSDITVDFPWMSVKLIVSDISTLGDYDLLPVPADYIDEVVKEVLRILGVVPPVEDVTNDANSQK